MIALDPLRQFSVERWDALCRYLQPLGKKEGMRWVCGSVNGEAGHSFDVNLQTGVFCDWATGERPQRGPINFWMAVRKVDFVTAVRELSDWLGSPLPPPIEISQQQHRRGENNHKGIYLPQNLETPTDSDLLMLSRSRSICVEALRIAVTRGFLHCFDDSLNGRC
jgi:hypothetical protein